MYVLAITNLTNEIDLPFFQIEKDFRWVYAISHNQPLLHNFKTKLESFTPEEYFPFIRIEILRKETLTENELENNFFPEYTPRNDKFYIEGIVNRNRTLSYNYDDFTPDKWNHWDNSENRSGLLVSRRNLS